MKLPAKICILVVITTFSVSIFQSLCFAQKLQLTKERKKELDAIAKSHAELEKAELAEREKSKMQFYSKERDPDGSKYKRWLFLVDSLKQLKEQEAWQVKRWNTEENNTLLKSADSNIRSLAINKSTYQSVPGEIYNFKKLDSLDLSDNEFELIGKELLASLSLVYLDISGNDISKSGLKTVRNNTLANLNLGNNKLTQPPASLKKLKGMTELNLSNNQLGSKSNRLKIRGCKELVELDLRNNSFSKIPKRLKRFKKLEKLYLNNNQITSLKGLEKLKSLKEVELSGNIVALDPRYFYSLQNLEKLSMHKCGLTYIPHEISMLKDLRKLVLPENRITYLPKEIGELSKLRTPDLS